MLRNSDTQWHLLSWDSLLANDNEMYSSSHCWLYLVCVRALLLNTVHTRPPGILLKCRYWFSGPPHGPWNFAFLTSSQVEQVLGFSDHTASSKGLENKRIPASFDYWVHLRIKHFSKLLTYRGMMWPSDFPWPAQISRIFQRRNSRSRLPFALTVRHIPSQVISLSSSVQTLLLLWNRMATARCQTAHGCKEWFCLQEAEVFFSFPHFLLKKPSFLFSLLAWYNG